MPQMPRYRRDSNNQRDAHYFLSVLLARRGTCVAIGYCQDATLARSGVQIGAKHVDAVSVLHKLVSARAAMLSLQTQRPDIDGAFNAEKSIDQRRLRWV